MLTETNAAEFDEFISSISPYLVRLLAILKYAAVNLQLFSTEYGEALRKKIDEVISNKTFLFIHTHSIYVHVCVNK